MTRYLPAFVWLLIITYLSTSPGISLPAFSLFSADKLAHAVVYGMLVVLLWFGHRRQHDLGKYWGISVFLGATLYGAFMEYIQATYFPGRSFEFDDMIANAAGAAAGWAIGKWRFG